VPNPKSAGNINLAAKENVSSGLRLLAPGFHESEVYIPIHLKKRNDSRRTVCATSTACPQL